MKDEEKKSVNPDGSPMITPGQGLDISKRSIEYPTPPCALDATTKSSKTFKSLKKKLDNI